MVLLILLLARLMLERGHSGGLDFVNRIVIRLNLNLLCFLSLGFVDCRDNMLQCGCFSHGQ